MRLVGLLLPRLAPELRMLKYNDDDDVCEMTYLSSFVFLYIIIINNCLV